MKRYRVKLKDRYQIEPEEIFLDKTIDHQKSEGRTVPEALEIKISDFRFLVLLILSFVSLFIFMGRVFYLNLLKGDYYRSLLSQNHLRYDFLRAPRGLIYDRFGKILATNYQTYSLMAVPADMTEDQEKIKATLDQINAITEIDKESVWAEIESKLKTRSIDPILIKSNLSLDEVRRFETEIKEKNGFTVTNDISRFYPEGPAFSTVLGYTGKISKEELKTKENYYPFDVIGKAGLELYYEDYLRGKNGEHLKEVNAKNEIIHDLGIKEPQPGSDLHLTLDADFQKYFYERLNQAISDLGISKAAGLALNPQTGEVLALVSLPSYDNNILVAGRPKKEVEQILNDKNQPFFNRIISGLYAPGSTIKPLVALAALEEKIISPDKKLSDENGQLVVENPYHPEAPSIFRDWKVHGMLNLTEAIAQSCNVYFYKIGGGYKDQKGLGIDLLKKYWQLFGLDQTRGLDLPGEKSGILPDPQWISQNRKNDPVWRIGDTYNVSIGQGDLALTPLEIATYFEGLISGQIFKPYLVKMVTDSQNRILKENNPEALIKLNVSPDNLAIVRLGMRKVVTEGSAKMLLDLPLPAAGKTGTPQIFGGKKINAFFVSYLPADNPQLLVLVLLEEPKEGSVVAIPVVYDVFKWYIENRLNHSSL